MKGLNDLLKKYKEQPSEALKDEIVRYMLEKNPDGIGDKEDYESIEGEWREFSNGVRVRKIGKDVFQVIEIYSIPSERFLCYKYEIKLSDYTPIQIKSCRCSFDEFMDSEIEDDYYTAFTLAMTHSTSAEPTAYIASGESDAKEWMHMSMSI